MTKLIAEFKRQDRHGTLLTEQTIEQVIATYDVMSTVDMVSIVVDEEWGGSPYDLFKAKNLTRKSILVKGMNLTVQHWLEAGADYVLTYDIEQALLFPKQAWLEVGPKTWVDDALDFDGTIVLNRRDVRTGKLYPGSADERRVKLPKEQVCVAASGYGPYPHACPSIYDYVLVGTTMLEKLDGRHP